jgi:protein O-mannosyl-transferase
LSKKKKNLQKPSSNSGISQEPWFLKYWKIVLFILILIVYGQTILFDFVNLDDDKIVIENYDKISSISDIPKSFVTQYGFNQGTPYYRPIVLISFIIDAQFSGTKPLAYHLTNLIIHYLTAFFIFLFFLRFDIKKEISFILTLIFAIHPVLSNAVVWIVGRNDMLAALFSISSIIYYLKFWETKNIRFYFLHSFLFIMAILSKEVALVLPVLLITITYFKYGIKPLKHYYKFLIVWSISIVIFFLTKSAVISEIGNLTYGFDAIKKNYFIIPEIIYKIFIPINISVLPTFSLTRTLIGGILFSVILVLPLFNRHINKNRYYLGLFWFLIFSIPGLSVYYADQNLRFDYLDSRIYLPIIGILLMLVEIRADNFKTKLKPYYKVTLLFILLTLSTLTFFQSKKYKNPLVFAESAVLSNPERPFFYHKLADYYFKDGRYNDAINNINIAISLDPKNFDYRKNQILAYANLKQYDNAIRSINDALRIKPNDPELIRGLMLMYYQKKDKINTLKYADLFISLGGKVDEKFYKSLEK